MIDGQSATVEYRPVRLDRLGGETAVLSGGIRPGELVVAAGGHFLHAGERVRPAGQAGRDAAMTGFNLSALAVRERAITLFLIAALSLSGIIAFLQLGRAEDPAFTIKVLTVTAAWPGATAQEMQDLVADPLEKRLQELRWYDRVRDLHPARPGADDPDAQGSDAAIRRAGAILPGAQEAGR